MFKLPHQEVTCVVSLYLLETRLVSIKQTVNVLLNKNIELK